MKIQNLFKKENQTEATFPKITKKWKMSGKNIWTKN
jgi:hypothetical protein